jgi:hypothetical protein
MTWLSTVDGGPLTKKQSTADGRQTTVGTCMLLKKF